jgi:hypothetical protein
MEEERLQVVKKVLRTTEDLMVYSLDEQQKNEDQP